MLLEKLDEVLAGDASILAARDPITTQPARVEPFTHRPGRNLTDLCDLAGGKDFFHGRHSVYLVFPMFSPGNAPPRAFGEPFPKPAEPIEPGDVITAGGILPGGQGGDSNRVGGKPFAYRARCLAPPEASCPDLSPQLD